MTEEKAKDLVLTSVGVLIAFWIGLIIWGAPHTSQVLRCIGSQPATVQVIQTCNR